jgi:hypothetical protein
MLVGGVKVVWVCAWLGSVVIREEWGKGGKGMRDEEQKLIWGCGRWEGAQRNMNCSVEHVWFARHAALQVGKHDSILAYSKSRVPWPNWGNEDTYQKVVFYIKIATKAIICCSETWMWSEGQMRPFWIWTMTTLSYYLIANGDIGQERGFVYNHWLKLID